MTLKRYLKRRGELGLDPDPAARLIVDPDGKPAPIERIEAEIIANLLLWLAPTGYVSAATMRSGPSDG